MKPRIRKEYSLKYKKLMWFCRGNGQMGISFTPLYAYRDWLWRMTLARGAA